MQDVLILGKDGEQREATAGQAPTESSMQPLLKTNALRGCGDVRIGSSLKMMKLMV